MTGEITYPYNGLPRGIQRAISWSPGGAVPRSVVAGAIRRIRDFRFDWPEVVAYPVMRRPRNRPRRLPGGRPSGGRARFPTISGIFSERKKRP
jgi:hypothetical protein